MQRFTVCVLAICLCVVAATSVAAQTELGLRGMGFKIGLVSPEDIDATVGFAVFADMGTIVPNLRLEPNLGFWTTSEEAVGTKFSVRDIAVGARAKYLFKIPNSKMRPFAGGGLGLHFLHASFEAPGIDTGDSDVKLGLDMGGGFFVPMNTQWDFTSELWYGIVSDVSQISFAVGVQYNFGI